MEKLMKFGSMSISVGNYELPCGRPIGRFFDWTCFNFCETHQLILSPLQQTLKRPWKGHIFQPGATPRDCGIDSPHPRGNRYHQRSKPHRGVEVMILCGKKGRWLGLENDHRIKSCAVVVSRADGLPMWACFPGALPQAVLYNPFRVWGKPFYQFYFSHLDP